MLILTEPSGFTRLGTGTSSMLVCGCIYFFFIYMSVCLSTWLSILTYLSFIMILLYFGIFCGVFVVAKYIFWLN